MSNSGSLLTAGIFMFWMSAVKAFVIELNRIAYLSIRDSSKPIIYIHIDRTKKH